ncbi:hypothetical protein Kpho02_72820 [Kitasatospora phosalacinea]|uniref:Uncharacterized protein n=1 Tax=Kitasatospora phosalacinea TaxID=2065 RepID=A0A9W6QD65_9ACTN|nr:hypothetical protein [Kitasatospora phosalacinea]GLW74985.1 hypothetical protein Kpho02_72820 [Kitasatospora phosalacinea]
MTSETATVASIRIQDVVWRADLTVNGQPYPMHYKFPDRYRGRRLGARALFTADGLTERQYTEMVAAHELGHAVLWLAAGLHVTGIAISGTGRGAGHTRARRTGIADEALWLLLGAVAGEVAQGRWLREVGLWTEDRAVLVEATAVSDRQAVLRTAVPAPRFGTVAGAGGLGQDYVHLQSRADQELERLWLQLTRALPHLIQQQVLTSRELADHLGLPLNAPSDADR